MGQYVTVGGRGNVISHVNISNVRSEDGGTYACQATNRAGSDLHSARLNIYGMRITYRCEGYSELEQRALN